MDARASEAGRARRSRSARGAMPRRGGGRAEAQGREVEGGALRIDGRPAPGHRHHARRNLEPAPLQGREEVGALQRHRREAAGNLSMKRSRIEARWSLAVATTKEETRPVRSTIAFGLTLMLALALASCSSGGASPTPSASTAPPATRPRPRPRPPSPPLPSPPI